jgi:hypothetical protein
MKHTVDSSHMNDVKNDFCDKGVVDLSTAGQVEGMLGQSRKG